MSQLSLREILKARRNSKNEFFLQKVRREIYNSQQKMSRKVYNIETRDIKKFIREQRAYQKKMNGKESAPKANPANSTKKYDENKLLQHTYSQIFTPKTSPKVQDDISARTIHNSSRNASSTRNVTFKNSLNNRYSFRVNQAERSKSPDRALGPRQKSNSLPNQRFSLRKRMATQWDLSPMKQSQSRMSLQKGQTSSTAVNYRASDQFIIDVTRDKMDRFICNLHRLQWASIFLKKTNIRQAEDSKDFYAHMKKFEYDPDSPIDEQAINFMISRRYQLHTNYLEDIYEQRDRFLTQQSTSNERKKLAEKAQYPILSALANHSVLRLLQKQITPPKVFKSTRYATEQKNSSEVYFALPYSQFISYKQTKNSIYQLVGMNARLGLKLVFSIFDKNRNGLVDEDDLLQLISLSRTIPTLQIDIAPLSKAMLTLKDKRSLQRSKIGRLESKGQSRLRETRERNITMMSKQSELSNISPIEQRDSDSESQLNQKSLATSRFSIDKLYTFLKQKEKGGRETSGVSKQTQIQPLNFLMFCKAFDFRRPYLLYDLFQFVLGASVGDFKEHIQTEINGYLNKLQNNHSQTAIEIGEEEETLEQKWNKRLRSSNAILEAFIRSKQ